jgi:hypothetical protein
VDEGESVADAGPFCVVTGRLPLPLSLSEPSRGESDPVDLTDVEILRSSRGPDDSGVVTGVAMTV